MAPQRQECSLILDPNLCPDSEKCSTPAAGDGHHFNIPPFHYTWTAYSGSELRHLVQGPYQHHLQGHRQPHSPVSLYGTEDSGTESFYAQRGPAEGCYQDYSSTLCRMRNAEKMFLDVKQKPHGSEIKTENDLICSNPETHGSYKCMKCCKVIQIYQTVEVTYIFSLIEVFVFRFYYLLYLSDGLIVSRVQQLGCYARGINSDWP